MKKLVFLTGAGVSAESGVATFRDSGGLWENYDVMKVASIEGWNEDCDLVQRFYNDRRAQLANVEPNAAHRAIALLQADFDARVITQNVDDLHERAGSRDVLHLHGELTKACNEAKTDVIEIGYRAIAEGEKAADGSRLRPFIVWFGETVELMNDAAYITREADIFVIVGTSLQVYPAASLIYFTRGKTPIYAIDPNEIAFPFDRGEFIREKASRGMEILRERLKLLAD
ncbi:MAG: NAD-dependent deacylase [Helicobacteraceae bacterium]|jgi:NAD-dependent deacetylase|nr:NAD-dependent deacylase [Helicobacteraceae bacterium]